MSPRASRPVSRAFRPIAPDMGCGSARTGSERTTRYARNGLVHAERPGTRRTAWYARNGFLRADQKAGVPPAIVTVEPDW